MKSKTIAIIIRIIIVAAIGALWSNVTFAASANG